MSTLGDNDGSYGAPAIKIDIDINSENGGFSKTANKSNNLLENTTAQQKIDILLDNFPGDASSSPIDVLEWLVDYRRSASPGSFSFQKPAGDKEENFEEVDLRAQDVLLKLKSAGFKAEDGDVRFSDQVSYGMGQTVDDAKNKKHAEGILERSVALIGLSIQSLGAGKPLASNLEVLVEKQGIKSRDQAAQGGPPSLEVLG